MFNMIVKGNAWAEGRDSTPASRVFEHTLDQLVVGSGGFQKTHEVLSPLRRTSTP